MSQNNQNRARPDESGVVQPLDGRDLTIANAIGKYRLLGALGHGGMADVYLAVADGPEGFRKLCVLKLLKEAMAQDDEYRAMFLDEARLAARLNHPNIVQTFEVGETHGRLMIAMEYVEGQAANRVRKRLTPEQFPLTSCIGILIDVCEALEYAHRLTDFDGTPLHIVHRDVSPQNIVIGYDARVKLLDFGIAKSSAALQETQAGVLKGKVGYMAPEQASMRHIDGRADVFSVGVILWETIAGRRLAEGVTAQEVLLRRVEGNDPKIMDVVPEVDPELAAICDRAMACLPEERHGSAAELQADLEGWLAKHKEPSRKELARSVREAFAVEREQLKVIVEQRMADSSLSGMRQALTGGLPSLGRLNTTGEVPSITPSRMSGGGPSAPPVSGPHLPVGQATLPMIDPASLPPSAQSSQQSAIVSALPPPQTGPYAAATSPSKPSPMIFVGIGLVAILAIAGIAYAVKSSSSTTPPTASSSATTTPSATETAGPATTDTAKVGTIAPPSTTTAGTTSSVAATPTGRGKPPPFVPFTGKGAPPPAHPPAAAAPPVTPAVTTATGTGLTPPTNSKQPARPLDEKDPYAP